MAEKTLKELFEKYKDVIDQSNLKIKHMTGQYVNLPNAPQPDDVLYLFLKGAKKILPIDTIAREFGEDRIRETRAAVNALVEMGFAEIEKVKTEGVEMNAAALAISNLPSVPDEPSLEREKWKKAMWELTKPKIEKYYGGKTIILSSNPSDSGDGYFDIWKEAVETQELLVSRLRLK